MGISDLIRNIGQASKVAGGGTPVDVIEFAESEWGLGRADPMTGKRFRLFPVQKIILKAHYGLELDDNDWGVDLDQPIPLGHPAYDEITNLTGGDDPEARTDDYGYYAKRIRITDWRRQNVRYMTEAEYLRYLYKEGRCNIDKVDGERRELVLSFGRRSGKTLIASVISAYETYKMLLKYDPHGYYGVASSNPIHIVSVATDKEQAGLLYKEVSGHFQGCFATETEIITDNGVKPIGTLVGTNQTLLTRDGSWVEAPIRSFGVQPLYKVTLVRQGIEKVIYATGNHRWFARDARQPHRGSGFREFTTLELRPGKHHLQSTFGRSYKNRIDYSPFGVAHGFTFGDGVTTKGNRNATQALLYGDKDQNLRPFFSGCPQRITDDGAMEVGALPNFFREKPSIQENKSYLLGWLMGYFAADGCVSNGSASICSVVLENLEFVQDVCLLLGIGTFAICAEDRISNMTNRPSRLYRMSLMRMTLDESFFLIPHHREAFMACGGSDVKRKVVCWTVKSVESTNRVEEVFCATVEGHGDFTLEGNVATGNCEFFSTYMAHSTQSFASFQTPRDIDKYGRYDENPLAKASIIVTFKSCIAKSVRGMGILVAILDEMAHFNDEGQSSAADVYDAIRPATAAYSKKHSADSQKAIGPVESRIVAISSPLGRQGKFYELFQNGMKGGAPARNMLCIQAPTWEVNPTIPASEFEDAYMKDPNVFATEFGGEFSDRTRGWIEHKQDLYDCIDPQRRPSRGAPARMPHFLSLDLALVNDYTGVAIGHLENTDDHGPLIVVDYVDRIHAGQGKYEHRERLEFDDVVDWVYQLSRKFYIAHGVFDQHCGLPFEQSVAKRGLTQMKMQHFTDVLNSEAFKNFKDLMWNKQLVLYDWPIPENQDHCDYIEELCELQQEQKTKNIVKVHKPDVEGKSDDMSDALVRMIWLASQHMASPKYLTGTHSGGFGGPRSYAGIQAKAMAAARRMGSSPDRQRNRLFPGRVMGR